MQLYKETTMRKQLLLTTLLATTLISTTVSAASNPDGQTINLYYQAAQGNSDATEQAVQALTKHIQQQGATPLSLVYLGAAHTLEGRDALLPWNKMKYVEQGIAKIDKGLALIDRTPGSEENNEIVMGLPGNLLAQANAATVFAELPDMFSQFDKGYELYLELLANPKLQEAPFAATAWIYHYAIKAALTANDQPQAQAWLNEMQRKNPEHPETIEAAALITAQG
jgi:hypothetical protein